MLQWLLARENARELVTKLNPKVPSLLLVAVMGKDLQCLDLLLKSSADPMEVCCLTWDDERFKIPHHHRQVGLCLMNSGILARPFDRISFRTNLPDSEFQRNVRTKLNEFLTDPHRSELKVLNSKDLARKHCDIIFSEAGRLGMQCVSPGEVKEDGSRRPLIVYKDLRTLLHSRRVLEDIDFRQRVRTRLEDVNPGS